MIKMLTRSVLVAILAGASPAAQANPVVSFGVQGGQPDTETLGGVTVRPADAVDVATSVIVFGLLPTGEDLDALHVREDGTVLFSTTTSVTLDGVTYAAGDLVAYDGVDYSLLLDSGLFGTVENLDAVSELPNGNLLISTATAATLFGFAFADGDVVEVDLAESQATLYEGLNEAALFTGANQNIDALHYDASNGHLLLSVAGDGPGTIGGYVVTDTGASADLIDLDLSSGVSGSLYLDGAGLYDDATRQLDAAFVIPQCGDGVDNDGDGATDFPADIGCSWSAGVTESPQCSDGVNNDPGQDGLIDADGGLWALGYSVTAPDPECLGKPWRDRERASSCGIGAEVAPTLAGLSWLLKRRRSRRRRA
jgi:hypothetical protein